jgi:hypothetical protein
MIANDPFVLLHLMFADGGREKNNGRAFELRVNIDLRGDVPAGHARHDDIEQDQVGFELACRLDGILGPVLDADFVIAFPPGSISADWSGFFVID